MIVISTTDKAQLNFLCGVHRIQRIPKNDKRGRRHTSTATVAILEPSETNVEINEKDIIVRTARGTGPGGQHRNTSDTKVTITHKPTGIVVKADTRSQHKSRELARDELGRRLVNAAELDARASRNSERLRHISSSERPVKSFTHNTQRSIVIDHETNKQWNMKTFMRGKF